MSDHPAGPVEVGQLADATLPGGGPLPRGVLAEVVAAWGRAPA
jgi:hypothetical protein